MLVVELGLASTSRNRARMTPYAIRCGPMPLDFQLNKTGQAAGEVRRRASLRMSLRVESSPGGDREPSRRSGIPSARRCDPPSPFRTRRIEKLEAAPIVQTIRWQALLPALLSSRRQRRKIPFDPLGARPNSTALIVTFPDRLFVSLRGHLLKLPGFFRTWSGHCDRLHAQMSGSHLSWMPSGAVRLPPLRSSRES